MAPNDKIPYLDRRAIVPADPLTGGARSKIGTELPDLNNVQGDVYYMFPKRWERFTFWQITDTTQFRKDLDTYRPRVTSSTQTEENIKRIHEKGENENLNLLSNGICFAKAGLRKLGLRTPVGDPHFDQGSLCNERTQLGDMADYHPAFAQNAANHGVFLVTAGSQEACKAEMDAVKGIFSTSISVVGEFEGRVRSNDGEHFGWKDGISQPALEGIGKSRPGQRVVKPGVIIMGYPGDPVVDNPALQARPRWTKDGSLMVFRPLEQNVLLFEEYIEKNWPSISPHEAGNNLELTEEERRKLFGARMVGRFKSGVPLAKCPFVEDTQYLDPNKINDFDYTERGQGCPLFAHIRKTVPRNLEPYLSKEYLDSSMIVRAGIPYGPEMTGTERQQWKTFTQYQKDYLKSDRGLLFVCYQSSIDNGFYRQTTQFGNNDFFPITSLIPNKVGQDPIIGGPKKDTFPKQPNGLAPDENNKESLIFDAHQFAEGKDGDEVFLTLRNQAGEKFSVAGIAKKIVPKATDHPQEFFVTSRGGDYYFVPPISTLKAWGAAK